MIIGRCTFDGCTVLTIGSRCVEHDVPVTRTFVRGKPFNVATAIHAATAFVAPVQAGRMDLAPGSPPAQSFARL